MICSARQRETEEVRQFRLPKLRFSATQYSDLIAWDAENVTEPLLLRDLREEELDGIAHTPMAVSPHPEHTQAVEWPFVS